MKLGYKLIDKLMEKPTKINLMALNKVLTLGIPFNAPHGFKIKKMSQEEVVIALPNRKLNHNHINGVHACAMATVGEYCAGLSLLSSFGISKYRLILSDLHATYSWQGRTELEGVCTPSVINQEAVREALESVGSYSQPLETIIREVKSGREVARVKTIWQLKAWEKVKTKS